MLCRNRFRSGRESIVQQPDYQEKVRLAFLLGEKPSVTVKNLKISRSTYYRLLSVLGIIISAPLHGGGIDNIQSFIANLPTPEPVRKHNKGHEIGSYQRREPSK